MLRKPGNGSFLARATLLVAVLMLLVPGSALAQETGSPNVSEQRATFPVADPPDGPLTVHQSMLRFVPGAAAPLHQHGGPGYITILEGEVVLYENGEEHVYSGGDSFVETPDNEYWAINTSDQDMLLMVTYLVPEGNEVTTAIERDNAPETPDVGPETLAERVYEYAEPPESFELIHSVRSFEPGAESEATSADGRLLQTVVGGTLVATVEDAPETLEGGDSIVIGADQEYQYSNETDIPVVTMSSEFVPDVYSLAPNAGATVDRTMVTWLFVMVATGVLIVGGILRISRIRLR